MSTKHTPGPWRHQPGANDGGAIYGPQGSVASVHFRERPDEHDANVRLIVAAPSLAEELEATEIALTNMLQVFGESALSDAARAKVRITRDRLRALLARIGEDSPEATA